MSLAESLLTGAVYVIAGGFGLIVLGGVVGLAGVVVGYFTY